MSKRGLLCEAALLCCLIFFSNCEESKPTNPTAHITDPKASAILATAIQTHGGLERWHSIAKISYTKAFKLLDSLGMIESQVLQSHDYAYAPVPHERISWKSGDVMHELQRRGSTFQKIVNGAVDTTMSSAQIRNAIFTSTYVHGIPYKLLDPGPSITYVGVEEIWTGEKCDVLQVVYDPDLHENLTTPDTWWYYFSQKDARVRAGKVKHLDHISGIRNISYKTVNGFLLNHERESYRLDANGHELYLRADYIYDDYAVELK